MRGAPADSALGVDATQLAQQGQQLPRAGLCRRPPRACLG
jgi:hypothetical protein